MFSRPAGARVFEKRRPCAPRKQKQFRQQRAWLLARRGGGGGGLPTRCDGRKCAKIACGNTWSSRRSRNFNRRSSSSHASNEQQCVTGDGGNDASFTHPQRHPVRLRLLRASGSSGTLGMFLLRQAVKLPHEAQNRNIPPVTRRSNLHVALLLALSRSSRSNRSSNHTPSRLLYGFNEGVSRAASVLR